MGLFRIKGKSLAVPVFVRDKDGDVLERIVVQLPISDADLEAIYRELRFRHRKGNLDTRQIDAARKKH